MSNIVLSYLKTNPLLTKYTQLGLVNINSLARYIKQTSKEVNKEDTIASIGMTIRRYVSKLPENSQADISTLNNQLHVVTRANLEESIYVKNAENRKKCLSLFNKISKTKSFSCLIEGEKEIVLLTDYPLKEKMKSVCNSSRTSFHTTGLGYISVDFPIKLRKVVGIYGSITSALASAAIPIHSFHTIGGEILILVKNDDLTQAQEVLVTTLKMTL